MLMLALGSAPVVCQELAPRAYWPGPKGVKVFSLGYVYTDGDVLVDPTLTIEGVNTTTNALTVAYYQIFGLAGRTAGLSVGLPAADTDIEARLDSEAVSRSISGFSDLQLRFGINLIGAPAMTPQEFQQFRQDPPRGVLGASLRVQVPTGKYNPDRAANLGTSRWAAKPELGYVRLLGKRERWVAEAALGAWIYGENSNFLDNKLEQSPLFAAEAHLVRRISPGRWVSLDFNYYEGGRTTVGGVKKDNRQQNSRLGATFVFPRGHHILKVAFSDSLRIKKGGDYLAVLLGYSYAWN